MDISLLSQVLGIYLIVGGLAAWMRRGHFAPILGAFAKEPLLRMVIGSVELIGGLLIAFGLGDWSTPQATIIMLIGWMLAVEGALYLILPDTVVAKTMRVFDNRVWYGFGGLVAIVLGIYLAGAGFGLWA